MRLIIVVLLICIGSANAAIDLQLQDASLRETLQLLANKCHKSIVIDKNVAGTISLQLKQADPKQLYLSILKAKNLAEYAEHGVWYVASQTHLLKAAALRVKWLHQQELMRPHHLKLWRIKYGNAAQIAQLLRDDNGSLLSKDVFLKVDKRSNSLCVIDTDEHILRASHLIKQLDVPVKQLVIEARIVRIDQAKERELGVSFGVLTPQPKRHSDKSVETVSNKYSLAVAKLANGALLDVKLSAMEKAGFAELISSPTLFASNQQSAFIESGEEVPYQETSDGGGTAVTFKKAVLGLKVTPNVLPGSQVLLSLEINQDRPSARLIQGVPTISTQKMKTRVVAADGQTVVLGGIFEKDIEQDHLRLPFISRIPLVGRLFEERQTRSSKRELLIFVTPKVVKPTT